MSTRRILDYQQKCSRSYLSSIELPADYRYPDGAPIRPLPPLKVAVGGLMIIGAYPSARFEQRQSRLKPGKFRTVPIADNLQPFGREEYFDGLKPTVLVSGETLAEYLLQPLEIEADHCWITDLVKVFLYKDTHIDSCSDSVPGFRGTETRSSFKSLARQSLSWIREECEICKPKVVVALGQEVAQVISGHNSWSATRLLSLRPNAPESLGHIPTIYAPHPDACRRYPKWRRHIKKQIPIIESMLR